MWVDATSVRLLGSSAIVRSDDRSTAAILADLLRPFVVSPGAASTRTFSLATTNGRVRLYDDCRLLLSSSRRGPALGQLVTELNRAAIDATEHFAVHAGVVAVGGRAVAIPGESGAGKSTLVAATVRGGAAYVSDEALVVDYATGEVVPYPKPIALAPDAAALAGLGTSRPRRDDDTDHDRADGEDGREEVLWTAGDLGSVEAEPPLRLVHVVLPQRRPGSWQLTPLEPADALSALLRLSFNHFRRPADAFALAGRLAAGARAWQLGYDRPGDGAAALRTLPDA